MLFNFLRSQARELRCCHFPVAVAGLLAFLVAGIAAATPGVLDTTFGDMGLARADVSGSIDNRVPSMLPMRDGSIAMAGTCLRSTYGLCVTRWSADGLLDTSFASGTGQAFATACAWSRNVLITEQHDGKLIVVASGDAQNSSGGDICVLRFTADGVLDSSFGNGGRTFLSTNDDDEYPTALTTLSDGRMLIVSSCVLVVGSGQTIREVYGCAFMLRANGALDTSFGAGGVAPLYFGLASTRAKLLSSVIEQPDGRILIGGTCSANGGGSTVFCAGKLTASGQFTPAMGGNFILAPVAGLDVFSSSPSDIYGRTAAKLAAAENGKLYVAGTCFTGNVLRVCVLRLNADGTLDVSFDGQGYLVVPMGSILSDRLKQISIQQDGKVLVTGSCSTEGAFIDDMCIARLESSGTLDFGFGQAGVVRITSLPSNQAIEIEGAQLLLSGKLVVSGGCRSIGSDYSLSARHCVIRLEGSPYPTQSCALNVDANLVTRPDSDAMLVLRYLTGYRSQSFIANTVGPNPGRSNAEIETYLADLLAQGKLDADGDGQSLAMTDGLLILRAMLGLTGDALTAGAVNTAHPNARNAQQILTWIESTHGVACLP